MRRVVRRGTRFAQPELAHSVHVEVGGLQPGREYFFRFRSGREESPVGRTKTAPAVGAALSAFSFAFASCQHYPSGYFTAYRHMADEDLDLVVHLGDYIYEGGDQGSLGRGHEPTRGLQTLDDYRVRLAQYKTDPDLQSVHARFPWVVTWDDHEVINNYADEIDGVPPEDFLVQRANAYRAYYEHMPLRRLQRPNGPDLPLYRRFAFGDLAEFNVLDTRQYRDDQAAQGDERFDPSRTLTGDDQERWLLDGLGSSRATWNVLAQQVFFAQLDIRAGAAESYNTDAWDGYVASRDRILSGIAERQVSNPIVLTGDVHRNYANNIKADFDDPDSATVASEFVATSISSFGDGSENDRATALLAENPHVAYYRNLRGYVRCELTPEQWRTDYRVVPYVTRPGAPIGTDATFVVESGNPGLQGA
jgi:alkaline phosphatase D